MAFRNRCCLDGSETVQLPEQMCINDRTIDSLITNVYPGIENRDKGAEYFLDRTILACRNDEVDNINDAVLAKFPGNACTITYRVFYHDLLITKLHYIECKKILIAYIPQNVCFMATRKSNFLNER